MMFAGAEDLICNYKGLERMIDGMEWKGDKGFGMVSATFACIAWHSNSLWQNTTKNEWFLNDTQVGEWTESRNLTYVKVCISFRHS